MMLCVYSRTGFHVLRTQILNPAELAEAQAHYEAMGYITQVE